MRQEGGKVFITNLIHSGIVRAVHVSRIKKLDNEFREEHVSAKDNYCEVERIVSHRFTTHGTLVVTVKWSDHEDTTEENLRSNPSIRRTRPFHDYCRAIPALSQFINGIIVFESPEA